MSESRFASPKLVLAAFAASSVLLSALSLVQNAPRAGLWTLIAVLAFVAARLRAAPVPVLALVATAPPVVAGLVARGTAGLVPALLFGLVFGLVCLVVAQMGARSRLRNA